MNQYIEFRKLQLGNYSSITASGLKYILANKSCLLEQQVVIITIKSFCK